MYIIFDKLKFVTHALMTALNVFIFACFVFHKTFFS